MEFLGCIETIREENKTNDQSDARARLLLTNSFDEKDNKHRLTDEQ